ncbi:MAG: Kynurenine 3-monooxygenase [Steroidobacteraceae bacterium]|nr:Kynurenine 3-monooxygenase [Steroidobacteraceae bacterium]
MSAARAPVNVVGGGLAGALLAIVLARRGFRVEVFERRADPRLRAGERGRSINLALAARGLRGLAVAGVAARIAPLLVPMRGRHVHEHDGSGALLAYGQDDSEVIYSVSREALGRTLIEAAAAEPAVTLHFGADCVGVDLARDALLFGEGGKVRRRVPLAPTIATDGAGSAVRAALAAAGALTVREEVLAHDYLELTIPRDRAAGLDPHALHIWPRGGFMLIALPNTDGSFTATLFLAREGSPSFAELVDAPAIVAFFRREFPAAVSRLPQLVAEFAEHPRGRIGTVYCDPWTLDGKVLLLGDAAHAIVPFHGQGMNCAFEDVAVLDSLLATHGDTAALFAEFARVRRPDTDAIAQMAIENYLEMRDTVRDPVFQRRKALGAALERAFPDRFIPRYSMVMFHPEISYAEALRRGAVQQEILAALDAADPGQQPRGGGTDTIPPGARALIEARLAPIGVRA